MLKKKKINKSALRPRRAAAGLEGVRGSAGRRAVVGERGELRAAKPESAGPRARARARARPAAAHGAAAAAERDSASHAVLRRKKKGWGAMQNDALPSGEEASRGPQTLRRPGRVREHERALEPQLRMARLQQPSAIRPRVPCRIGRRRVRGLCRAERCRRAERRAAGRKPRKSHVRERALDP